MDHLWGESHQENMYKTWNKSKISENKIINFNLHESFLELILCKEEPLFKLTGEFHITG